MIIDGLDGGILRTWEGVLKFATKAKLNVTTTHIMEIIIAFHSYFLELKFWYKYHLMLTSISGILNLFTLMHKLSRWA